jgi:hypothetical protein
MVVFMRWNWTAATFLQKVVERGGGQGKREREGAVRKRERERESQKKKEMMGRESSAIPPSLLSYPVRVHGEQPRRQEVERKRDRPRRDLGGCVFRGSFSIFFLS